MHVPSMVYDDNMHSMHVCIFAFSQITLYSAVCMLCNLIIIQLRAFGSWYCLYSPTLFIPVSGCNPFPFISLHEIEGHVQSLFIMKTHIVHVNLFHVKGFHFLPVLSLFTQCLCTLKLSCFFCKPGINWYSKGMSHYIPGGRMDI